MNENCLRRWELKGHPDPKQAEMHPFVCIIQQFSVLLHDDLRNLMKRMSNNDEL